MNLPTSPKDKRLKDPISDREAFFRSGTWVALATLAAGVVGVFFLAELRAGPFISGALALSIYALMTFGLPRAARRRALIARGELGVNTATEPVKDPDPRVELLVEAHAHLEGISAAVPKVPLPLGATLTSIVARGRSIVASVTASPEKLNSVVRFFTYYLPATADLVDDRVKLGTLAGATRLAEIDQTLQRLDAAFETFNQGLLAPDLEAVDMDIELLDKALDDDLRDVSAQK
jgi:5-bromo-4-chloroindolyl phosphate hydrolysis protein